MGPGAGSVETVLVEPATATVAIGSTLTLAAAVLDVRGDILPSPRISWASADPAVADVNQDGVVTGLQVGTVLIAASARGKDAFARITVNPTPVASIRLSATHRTMFVGQTVQLSAEPLDARGGILSGRPITWTSSDAAIATVSQSGAVTALAAGAAIITASAEGRSAVATITVSQVPVARVEVTPATNAVVVGQTTQLTAHLEDAAGGLLTDRVITWSTSNASVATVTSEGLVTAIAAGAATITATSEGRSGSASITVNRRPVSAVIVSPGQVTLFPRQTVQLSALVTDDRGQVLAGRPVSFSSNNSQVATVSAQGLVTGIGAGTATITATSEGTTGTATITIAPDPVAFVEVSPASGSIVVGNTAQLTAIPRSVNGLALAGRTVTWSSSTPALASVSASGVVTGLAPGNAVIIATVEGKQGSAAITVRAVPVASVSVTPTSATTVVGQSVSLTAVPRDAAGNPLTGRVVGWASSDNAIATVSSSGVVTGVASGTVTITASSDGQSGTATVTVTSVPVASVAVTPATTTVTVGQTVQLAATARDASGQTLTGRAVTWTSASPGIASVSGSGLVSGVSAGSTTITATIDGVPGATTVTVGPVPIGTVSVSPSTVTLNPGQTSPLSATVRDANGGTMANAQVSWTSSNSGVATVTSSGVVTAMAPGSATITASSGGVSGSATVTVAPLPVGTVSVSPSTVTLNPGQTSTLTATVRDANGGTMTNAQVSWTSSNSAVATVTSSGVVTAVASGSATIRASSGGVSGTATVTVTAPAVARIVITPSKPRVEERKTIQLTATAYDAANNVITGLTFTWTSSNTNRATVSSTGLVTGLREGNVTITASAGGKSTSVPLKVED